MGIFETATGAAIRTLESRGSAVLCGSFRHDGHLFASGSADGSLRIWDVTTGAPQAEFRYGASAVSTVAFSPTGVWVATVDADGAVALWEVGSGRLVRSFAEPGTGTPRSLAFSDDGARLVCGTSRGDVLVYRVDSGQIVSQQRLSDAAQGVDVVLGPGGRPAVSADWHSIGRWDPFGDAAPASTSLDEPLRSLAVHPDGELLAVVDSPGNVQILDTLTGVESLILSDERNATLAAFSPDGRWLAAATNLREIRIWDGAGESNPAASNATAPDDQPDARWRRSIDRGLAWLAAQQAPDGSFGSVSSRGPSTGITGLAGLAFLGEGSVPGRGRYGANLQRCLRFILANRAETGLLCAQKANAAMYEHSFAVIFLAALHRHAPTDEVKAALVSAVRLIEGAQNEHGGWRYNPVPFDADVSVTACQVVALRAAANAGVPCAFQTLESAKQFMLRCQNPDGGFRYQLDNGPSGLGRSAAAQAALLYIGQGGEEMSRGLAYLEQWHPQTSPKINHVYYLHYYAAQVMWQASGSLWAKWWPDLRESLIAMQQADGSWKDPASGDQYATSIGLIVLQFPTGTLPMLPPPK